MSTLFSFCIGLYQILFDEEQKDEKEEKIR